MNKTILSVMVSLLSISMIMISIGPQLAKGAISDYYAKVGSPGDDQFCFCVHNGDYNTVDDRWVVLGMDAIYGSSSSPYSYLSCSWYFEAGVGGNGGNSYWFDGTPSCTYAYNQYGYWSGSTYNMPGGPYWGGDRYYWTTTMPGEWWSDQPTVVSGMVYALFQEIGNPYHIDVAGASPNPVDELTAQSAPVHYHIWSG